ncbi:GT-D fold domain-containing glycosyltransferase [Holdemania massiliensis]|uniref:GT-D fold domain-containing glycosyltransferase n=1 Tax=Holdemania massiliensis TaxID=1468449 RepID=UPI002675FB2F|nr:GT-D fold domain-containing glycosyltransferase [Holdemania massiliensis]
MIKEILRKSKVVSNAYEELHILKYTLTKGFYKKCFHIYTEEETLNLILKEKKSISRFGDGELDLIENRTEGYQRNDVHLQKRLKEILKSNSDNCLICIIDALTGIDRLTDTGKRFWKINLSRNYSKWKKYTNRNYCYGNATITRPYLRYASDHNVQTRFDNLKKIWKDKNVLIVEGAGTRLGVKNDLLQNAKKIERILCPAENAFDKYEEIQKKIIDNFEHDLVLLALGPTATVLAYDLSELGIWTIDIGHIDLEYEYWLRKWKNGGNIEYKYVNSIDGKNFEKIEDMDYNNSILEKII